MNIPINTDRIVYEGGVELKRLSEGKWSCASMEDQQFEISPQHVDKDLQLRVVLINLRVADDCSTQSLVPVRRKRLIIFELSEIDQRLLSKNVSFYHASNLIYLCRASSYHCHRLCEVYCELSRDQREFVTKYPVNKKHQSWILSYRPEGYYEFDALMGVVRRAYEAAKFILWSEFGAKHDTPDNFARVLDLIKDRIPAQLYERLSQSWMNYGTRVKDYRDCIHHYCHLAKGPPYALAKRLGNGIWAVSLFIPDNPEERSPKSFTYEKKLDAMIYG